MALALVGWLPEVIDCKVVWFQISFGNKHPKLVQEILAVSLYDISLVVVCDILPEIITEE